MKNTIFLTICLFAILTISAAGQTTAKMSKDETIIRGSLERTAKGWNDGILSEYLSVYTKGATEMLSTGPAGGVEAIEKTMKEGFWKTGKPLQKLHYESLEIRFLGKKGALVTGKYVLTGAEKPDRTGWFTTVWEKTKDGWRMIHDHS